MKRRTIALALALILLLSLSITVNAADPAVVLSPQAIVVDGAEVEPTVYNIDGNNYFKLRDIAFLLNGSEAQFNIEYDDATRTISIEKGAKCVSASKELIKEEDKSDTCVASSQILLIDGVETALTAYNIGGNNYFKLRDLGEKLSFAVSYDEATNAAVVNTRYDGVAPKGTLYTLDCDIPYLDKPTTEYQCYDLYLPEGEAPAEGWPLLIYVHGGGFVKGDKQEAGSSLNAFVAGLDYGYAVAAINYTVTGEKTVEAIQGEIVDVKAAVRYFKANADELGFNADKYVLAGPSAGGGLVQIVGASWNSDKWDEDLAALGAVEADEKVAAIVAYAGAAHFDDVYPELASVYFDAEDPALFLRHGDIDPIVACSVSEDMAKAAEEAGIVVDYRAVEGAKHTFQNFFALYDVEETFAWLEDIVKPYETKGVTEGGTEYTLNPDVAYLDAPTSALQALDFYTPEGEAPEGGWPVMVYVHGGGFKQGDKAKAGNELNVLLEGLDYGMAGASVNYRLSGTDLAPAQVVDVKSAIRYLKANAEDLGINPDKIVLFAPSAGANIAIVTALSAGDPAFDKYLEEVGACDATDSVAGIAAMHPTVYLADLESQFRWLAGESYPEYDELYADYLDKLPYYTGRFEEMSNFTTVFGVVGGDIEAESDLVEIINPHNYIDENDPPFLIRHGDEDMTVPFVQSVDLANALEAAGVSVDFEIVPGAEHGNKNNFFKVYDATEAVEWLAEIVK